MSVHEPMTLATDYLLCIVASVFAARLWRPFRLWALAFLFTAAASLLGGTYHGFVHVLTPLAASALWKATVYSVGLASFFLLAGSGRALAVVAAIKLVVFATWMITHDEFLWVIADYGTTLILVGAVQLVAWIKRRAPSARWVLGSILVSVIGAVVQQQELALHRHFNHNDLYHVIQMVALWLLYRGGALMTTATRPPTIRPM
ncbi:MAG TPA: hypothetical protein VNA69_20615 [Thermoanaerobaculia bacterium]|nr:hypothetical protein [Thermoanaerobaculia bacterium]